MQQYKLKQNNRTLRISRRDIIIGNPHGNMKSQDDDDPQYTSQQHLSGISSKADSL